MVKFILIFSLLTSVSQNVLSQTRIDTINSCSEKVLSLSAGHIKTEKIFFSALDDKEFIEKIGFKEWFKFADKEKLEVFKCSKDNLDYYVFISRRVGATGLAVNQWVYFVVQKDSELGISFASLCHDPKSVYFENDSETLRYIEFGYSDEFFHRRDWDKLSYKAKYYAILHSKHELMKEIDGICPK